MQIDSNIIIAIVGICSTIVSFILGRRKYDAEVRSIQLEYTKKMDKFYSDKITELASSNRRISRRLNKVESMLVTVVRDACTNTTCLIRQSYSTDKIDELYNYDDSIDMIDSIDDLEDMIKNGNKDN